MVARMDSTRARRLRHWGILGLGKALCWELAVVLVHLGAFLLRTGTDVSLEHQ